MAYVLRDPGSEVREKLEGFDGVIAVYSTPSEQLAGEVVRAQMRTVGKPHLFPEWQRTALALFSRIEGIEYKEDDFFVVEKNKGGTMVTNESMAVLRPLAGSLCELAMSIVGTTRGEEKN